jgi:hypothetical protein
MALNSPEGQDLLEEWREATGGQKHRAWRTLVESGIFPSKQEALVEQEAGLYPGIEDPNLLPKLMRKREFQESKQPSVKESLEKGEDKCRTTEDFELSSVQRFVSRFLSPRTPFRSALLFHGVGVGKTCAAVTVCESYLEINPDRKAFVIAPPTIQDGFRRTLFDKEALLLPEAEDEDASHKGCTGDIYLKLTGTQKEKNKAAIERKVASVIKSRYEILGYSSFYNYIHSKLKFIEGLKGKISDEQLEERKKQKIREEFSDRVIVIDEAHNLRDNPFESSEDTADDQTVDDSNEAKAGKKLTPYLREILEVAENVTLVLMTATPMYNSYLEIIFLLNLLLLNDKRATIVPSDIFDVKTETFKEGGRELLGSIASCYISYMRGENPLTFPMRIEPEGVERVKGWPIKSPRGELLKQKDRINCVKLPFLAATFSDTTEREYKAYCKATVSERDGLNITNRDQMIQAGNWIFPVEGDMYDRKGESAFNEIFTKEKKGSLIQYRSNIDAGWLLEDRLNEASGKCKVLVKRLNNCKGLAFVYSRL